MLIKSRYSNLEMFLWTRFATLKFIGYAFVIGLFYEFLGYYFLRIPWAPLAVIGTAVAFIVGSVVSGTIIWQVWRFRESHPKAKPTSYEGTDW